MYLPCYHSLNQANCPPHNDPLNSRAGVQLSLDPKGRKVVLGIKGQQDSLPSPCPVIFPNIAALQNLHFSDLGPLTLLRSLLEVEVFLFFRSYNEGFFYGKICWDSAWQAFSLGPYSLLELVVNP